MDDSSIRYLMSHVYMQSYSITTVILKCIKSLAESTYRYTLWEGEFVTLLAIQFSSALNAIWQFLWFFNSAYAYFI
jgi:hypothetical protein